MSKITKDQLLEGFQNAYDSQWRPSLIEISDVKIKKATNEEVISWIFVNSVPKKDNKEKRKNFYYKVVSVFDCKTGLWTSSSYQF